MCKSVPFIHISFADRCAVCYVRLWSGTLDFGALRARRKGATVYPKVIRLSVMIIVIVCDVIPIYDTFVA